MEFNIFVTQFSTWWGLGFFINSVFNLSQIDVGILKNIQVGWNGRKIKNIYEFYWNQSKLKSQIKPSIKVEL